jgi:hypothetical protein
MDCRKKSSGSERRSNISEAWEPSLTGLFRRNCNARKARPVGVHHQPTVQTWHHARISRFRLGSAYDAPFPDSRFKAESRTFPDLEQWLSRGWKVSPLCRFFLRSSYESSFSARASRMTTHHSDPQELQVKSSTIMAGLTLLGNQGGSPGSLFKWGDKIALHQNQTTARVFRVT